MTLSALPVEILLEIIQFLPITTIVSLHGLSKLWAAFLATNESSIYHNISKRHGYTSEGDLDAAAPSEGWKALFIRKFQIELRWIGKLPGNLCRIKAPEEMGFFHRIKVDEEAGYVINTFTDGGLFVLDIHDYSLLWSLDEEACEPFVHCEYDQGYLVFNRFDNHKEVWRRRVDVLDTPEESWPSGSHNKPDEIMIKGNRVAESLHLDASRSRDPDHLRGQFVPWAHLLVPDDGRAFKLTRRTLLVSSFQRAFLFDVEKAELQQTIELGTLAGRLRYVDLSDQHVFIVCTLQLSIYDRTTSSRVLTIPGGRQPWDFYASPGNQWRRTEQSLNHGELGFRRAVPPNWAHRDDGFHAVHVSSCGKHLAIKAMSNRVILVQDFWRLLPALSSSSSSTLIPTPTKIKDISKQVDFYPERPSPETEGYLAYDRGKVAIIGTHGAYVLVLDSILDQLEEIKPLPKDISLRTQYISSKHRPSWPNLRLLQVGFNDPKMFNDVTFSCLQLTETKLFFSLIPDHEGEGWDGNMWCYDFASSPSFTAAHPSEEGGWGEEGDWGAGGDWVSGRDWSTGDWSTGDWATGQDPDWGTHLDGDAW